MQRTTSATTISRAKSWPTEALSRWIKTILAKCTKEKSLCKPSTKWWSYRTANICRRTFKHNLSKARMMRQVASSMTMQLSSGEFNILKRWSTKITVPQLVMRKTQTKQKLRPSSMMSKIRAFKIRAKALTQTWCITSPLGTITTTIIELLTH